MVLQLTDVKGRDVNRALLLKKHKSWEHFQRDVSMCHLCLELCVPRLRVVKSKVALK